MYVILIFSDTNEVVLFTKTILFLMKMSNIIFVRP